MLENRKGLDSNRDRHLGAAERVNEFADVSQKFTAYKLELVVLAIEAVGIQQEHLDKALGDVLHLEEMGQLIDKPS